MYFGVAEKTERQELKSLLNELSDLPAVRLLVLFMEDILDVVLDVYICPVMQSNTNREGMMWLCAHLHLTFVCNRYASSQTSALHDKPGRFSGITAHVLLFSFFPPSENYHQLTFEAHYVTVVVEVEQSGDPRSRANSEHHIHIHLYQQCQ